MVVVVVMVTAVVVEIKNIHLIFTILITCSMFFSAESG